MDKIKAAILGSGNIGMNLLYKIKKSPILECSYLVGRNPDSVNLKKAKEMGYNVSADSIQALVDHAESFDIIFDATTAESHIENKRIFQTLNKYVVDLTPSKNGIFCIPCLNKEESIKQQEVNMVTCGGQSMVPIATAITGTGCHVSYLETISTISSISAGEGTRSNIDEYIETTSDALKIFTGVEHTKAMIILNPSEPPILMRNTLYAVADDFNLPKITKAVAEMEERIKFYVPGYQVIVKPVFFADNIITVSAQVEGTGDFLPAFAGNLDIITCAGLNIAEAFAYGIIKKSFAFGG